MQQRPSRDEIFMEMCHVLRKRSTCLRGKVGAVLVSGNRIVATGYNGAPPGAPHCSDLGCDVPENAHEFGCQRIVHAEANVIAYAARGGISSEGAHLYCTHGPCPKCAQLIVSAGIIGVTYGVPYRLPEGLTLLIESGVEVVRMPTHYIQQLESRHYDAQNQWGPE